MKLKIFLLQESQAQYENLTSENNINIKIIREERIEKERFLRINEEVSEKLKEADLRNKSYKKLEERFISQITKIESSNKDYMDEIDANKNQMKIKEDHNSQLKRNFEKPVNNQNK